MFAGTCVAGLTPDRCGCCQVGTRGTWPAVCNVTWQVCARSEAELCDVSVVDKYGVCGDNLECVHQQVLYCTVLYCVELYCTALYCTVLYCTVLQEEGEMICVCR